MNQFKDLGIAVPEKKMSGDKIKIERILNRQVVVHDFEIKPSRYVEKGNGKCLYLQIEIDNVKRVVFTGSVVLQELILKIPTNKFPFTTTIVKQNERFEFT